MYFGFDPLAWWNKFSKPPVKKTKTVKVIETYETTLVVPVDIEFERRREWAYLDAGLGRGRRVKIKQEYKD